MIFSMYIYLCNLCFIKCLFHMIDADNEDEKQEEAMDVQNDTTAST